MSWITEPEAWIAFATLLGLEIVLGVDNIIFISILAAKLPKAEQAKPKRIQVNPGGQMAAIAASSPTN